MDKNQNDHQNQDEGGQQQSQGQKQGGKGSLLDYYFYPYKGAVGFQITKQHPAITRFLEQQPGGYFQASNGLIVTTGPLHPEWKESKNTIRLDGTGGFNIDHIDITFFQTVFDNHAAVRDNHMNMFNAALEELGNVVKDVFSEALRYDAMRRDKRSVRRAIAI
jgi:hypothetical protein